MANNYRIYLDACCLNRPFDDQRQDRIALETKAILSIINQCQIGAWRLITSTALDLELEQTPDLERLKSTKMILSIAKIKVISSQFIDQRSRELQSLGFTSFDATHVASAERSKADIFLTTDDRLVKKAAKNTQIIQVKISNPIQWLLEASKSGENDND
jgi:predicted nucleic acid-binding protein